MDGRPLMSRLRREVARLCQESNYTVREDVQCALQDMMARESGRSRRMLGLLLQNIEIARRERIAVCQDTGLCEVVLRVGPGLPVDGAMLREAVEAGVRDGYRDGYLRRSVVADPIFDRINTGDNTPALIFFEWDGPPRSLEVTVFPKGFGSENMGVTAMLSPAEGRAGVVHTVVDAVDRAGPNACPPVGVGVGGGGTLEVAAGLARKALLRPLISENEDIRYAELEGELLQRINDLDIGVQGLGGRVTCLGVHVEHCPTHIAGLPVAVNISCYALRQASAVIEVANDSEGA